MKLSIKFLDLHDQLTFIFFLLQLSEKFFEIILVKVLITSNNFILFLFRSLDSLIRVIARAKWVATASSSIEVSFSNVRKFHCEFTPL